MHSSDYLCCENVDEYTNGNAKEFICVAFAQMVVTSCCSRSIDDYAIFCSGFYLLLLDYHTKIHNLLYVSFQKDIIGYALCFSRIRLRINSYLVCAVEDCGALKLVCSILLVLLLHLNRLNS